MVFSVGVSATQPCPTDGNREKNGMVKDTMGKFE